MLVPKNTLLPLLALLFIQFFQPILAVRGDACGKYACGSATWKWNSKTSIKDVSLSVKDTNCNDDNYVYIYLKYKYSYLKLLTKTANVLRFENHKGCEAKNQVKNTPFLDVGRNIKEISVYVCRSDKLKDTCYSSGYLKNQRA